MKTLKFKTNINCSGCVSKVTPFLNKHEGIVNWEVDTDNPDKILTVESDSVSAEGIKATLQKVGFMAEKIGLD